MRKYITFIAFALLYSSDVFARTLHASDIDPTDMFSQISLIVGSVVAFLTFIYGSKRVLAFIG